MKRPTYGGVVKWGTDNTKTAISKHKSKHTKRSSIKSGKETCWLNLNQAETMANSSAGVNFKSEKEVSVFEWAMAS